MRLPFSSPTSISRTGTRTGRPGRRAFTLVELVTAAGLSLMTLLTVGALLSMCIKMTQSTLLSTSANTSAVKAINRMILDIREAKQVNVLASNHIQIFFPVMGSNGMYDRTRLDTTHWIDYAETNSAGTLTAGGGYLWRKTESSTGWSVAKNIQTFTVTSFASNAIRLTVDVNQQEGSAQGTTHLDQRVIYLRNY